MEKRCPCRREKGKEEGTGESKDVDEELEKIDEMKHRPRRPSTLGLERKKIQEKEWPPWIVDVHKDMIRILGRVYIFFVRRRRVSYPFVHCALYSFLS